MHVDHHLIGSIEQAQQPLPYDPEPLDGMLVTDGSWCALTGCPNRGDVYRNKVPWCQLHYRDGHVIAHLERHWGARA